VGALVKRGESQVTLLVFLSEGDYSSAESCATAHDQGRLT
jgi:hypothetical protein